jgi:hypothetical protein
MTGPPGTYSAPMSTWIRRPADEAPQRWHLVGLLPSTRYHVYAACGQRWAPSEAGPLERTQAEALIPDGARCPACTAIHDRRAAGDPE